MTCPAAIKGRDDATSREEAEVEEASPLIFRRIETLQCIFLLASSTLLGHVVETMAREAVQRRESNARNAGRMTTLQLNAGRRHRMESQLEEYAVKKAKLR